MLYVLPDSAGDILVVQATDVLTEDDYQNTFLIQISKQLKTGLKLRVVLYLDHNLKQIEQSSAWHPLRFFLECEAQIIRTAIVGSSQWHPWASSFLSANVKHFQVTEFLSALHWTDEAEI